jgi:hypothetical protein
MNLLPRIQSSFKLFDLMLHASEKQGFFSESLEPDYEQPSRNLDVDLVIFDGTFPVIIPLEFKPINSTALEIDLVQ